MSLFASLSLVALNLAPDSTKKHLLQTFDGAQKDDLFGKAVASADVNDDGFSDILVGSPFADPDDKNLAGQVEIFSGEWIKKTFNHQVPLTSKILLTLDGTSASDRFGESLDDAGDVNNDGACDIIVGARGASSNQGYVQVFSGDGTLLFTFNGENAFENFGFSVSGAGDVNQDGHADLIVGTPFGKGSNNIQAGYARIFSGKTGAVLHTFFGENSNDDLGHCVSQAGDINQDGFDDVIVGAPGVDSNDQNLGRIYVYSGEWITKTSLNLIPLTPETLAIFDGDKIGDEFGTSVSTAGDMNSDGFLDIVAGALELGSLFDLPPGEGYARVFSGKWISDFSQGGNPPASEKILFDIHGNNQNDRFGITLSAGDFNQDGFSDLMVGASQESNAGAFDVGYVRVISGQDQSVLAVFRGESLGDKYATALSQAGDIDQDGHTDLVVGASNSDIGNSNTGSVKVYSGKPLTLLETDRSEISVSSGGTVSFCLDGGPQAANKLFLILGSASGTQPGTPLGPLVLPLNADAYTNFTLTNANTSFLNNTFGQFDNQGQAIATLNMPAGFASGLSNATLFHAYIVIDPSKMDSIESISNSVSLDLKP